MITIRNDLPLAPFTSFGIGGPARYFTEISSAAQLREALLFARERGIPHHILGGGTNLLVSDSGFPGLVIRACLTAVTCDGETVVAEAGVELMRLVQCAQAHALSGVERLAGIPGTAGGAIRGNAGAYGSAIGDVVQRVTALEISSMQLIRLPAGECRFGYRSSRFKEGKDLVVVSGELSLHPAPAEAVAEKVQETLARRLAKNLHASRSVGSYFMNPLVTDRSLIETFETQRGVHCRDCRIPAGWFIDTAGLRGARVGGAMVSEQHANYIINTGDASAAEVLQLAAIIVERVRQEMGVELKEEVCRLGF